MSLCFTSFKVSMPKRVIFSMKLKNLFKYKKTILY